VSSNVTGFTGNIPEHYDKGLGPVLFVDYADDIARRTAAFAPKRVLETAAGTGFVTRRLRDLMPAAEITATDLNAPMLQRAAAKFTPKDKIKFQPADATALPFPDKAFDTVVCQFGIMFYPDKEKSYREAHRVLAPGGRYLFSVWDSLAHNPFGRIVHGVACSFFAVDPPQFYQTPFGYYKIDPVKEALLDAGFRDIAIAVVQKEKTIGDSAAQLGNLIDALLAFSRMGRTEMRQKRISLTKLVEEARAALQQDAKGRRIEWQIAALPEVQGDPLMLRQVILNLLSNALKYTRNSSPARIEIDTVDSETETIFFVRDNGVGFDMKYVEKLFGVFQRLHAANEFEGTGIGLANVRRIIHRHGGHTWAEGTVSWG